MEKKVLTPEELEKRKQTNTKILKYGCLPIIVFIVVIMLIAKFSDTAPSIPVANNANIDSLKLVIEKDNVWKVTEVKFEDSIFKIAVKPEDDSPINTYYFEKTYKLTDYDNILEIELYENKISGKSVTSFGYLTGRIIDDFNKEFVSSYDGECRPLVILIKSKMNDESSYEHEKTVVNYIGNNKFQVVTQFRGKNAFGAKVLNEITATIDKDGNILDAK